MTASIFAAIDLKAGVAVHATGGRRSHYQPISQFGGDLIALAEHYLSCGARGFYVADLDAIAGSPADIDRVQALAALGCPIWLDGGFRDAASVERVAQPLLETASGMQLIVATETLVSLVELSETVGRWGPDRIGASLDYRGSRVVSPAAALSGSGIEVAAKAIAAAGVARCLVMDLAGFGTAAGPQTVEVCQAVRAAAPSLRLASGGGVRGAEDIRRLHAAGCDTVLCTTALLEGGSSPLAAPR